MTRDIATGNATMSIEQLDVNDVAVVEELLTVRLAAHAADEPDNPAPCRVHFRASAPMTSPYEKKVWHAARLGGRMVGYYDMYLPTSENTHFSFCNVIVHPDYRRRGYGQALVEHAMKTAKQAGRRVFNIDVLGTLDDGPIRSEAGWRLLEKLGFSLALTEINRNADITAIEPAAEQRLLDEARDKSTEYETVAWHGRMPDELVGPIAKINSKIIDEVPLGDLELEAETFDIERMRWEEERNLGCGVEVIGVVARPKGSTEVVASTVIGVPAEPGDVAHQWITIVDPGHRGHRLGMRTKIENLRQLRKVKPDVRYIYTDNADVNAPMVAINDAIGFKPVDALFEYQIDI